MFTKPGLRKIIVGTVLVLIGVLVDLFAKTGLSANLLDLLKFVGVGFYLGNGLEHMAIAVKKKKVASPGPQPKAPEVDMSGVEDKLDRLERGNKVLSEAIQVNQQQAAFIIDKAFGPQQK